MKKKIKVLIVDDSAVVRQTLSDVLSTDPGIEVMGTAPDPFIAAEKIRNEKPDVITLDIEMPRMDGLTFLNKIMSQHPIPVVIVSALTEKGSETALKAIELGAVEIIPKSRLGTSDHLKESEIRICDVVKAAAIVKIEQKPKIHKARPKHSADVIISKRVSRAMIETTNKLVVVGASTGGTEAIKVFLESMPHDAPGMVIVQHMPEIFTKSLATSLDHLSRMTVKEAKNGDSIIRGRALIAPGNFHVLIQRSGARYYVKTSRGPLVNHHRPSVDVLFRSAARYAGKNAIGVIMTGMGDDGASGMLELREAGAYTIAQDKETSVIFGMPNEAIKKDIHRVSDDQPSDQEINRKRTSTEVLVSATYKLFNFTLALSNDSQTELSRVSSILEGLFAELDSFGDTMLKTIYEDFTVITRKLQVINKDIQSGQHHTSRITKTISTDFSYRLKDLKNLETMNVFVQQMISDLDQATSYCQSFLPDNDVMKISVDEKKVQLVQEKNKQSYNLANLTIEEIVDLYDNVDFF